MMRRWMNWWLIASIAWAVGVAALIYDDFRGREVSISSIDWIIVGSVVLLPPVAILLLGKIFATLIAMDDSRRATILKSLGFLAAVVAILFFANTFLRYQTFNVGDGKIMQVDRLTQQVRTCAVYHRCSSWRD